MSEKPPEDLYRTETEQGSMTFLDSGHWFVWDPCGIVCAVMTYLLILYGEFVVLAVLLPPFPTLGTIICVLTFTSFAALATVAHVRAMMTDPVSGGRTLAPPILHITPPPPFLISFPYHFDGLGMGLYLRGQSQI